MVRAVLRRGVPPEVDCRKGYIGLVDTVLIWVQHIQPKSEWKNPFKGTGAFL